MMSDYFVGRRVLVTGASGFIGTNLILRLKALGADVRGAINKRAPQQPVDGVEYVQCDLTRAEDCKKVTENIDFVFMAAANSSGAAVMEKTPLVHLTPNVVMNALMLEAAYANSVKKFCFISSNTVYPLTDFAVAEDDANYQFFEKYFVVGWMKRFSEIMCEMYSTKISEPMSTLVVRPGNLYGPYDKFNNAESKVIAALIRRAIEKETPYTVWGDGKDIKDFIFIDDFVDGLLRAFEYSEGFETINIASGDPISIREIVEEILSLTEHDKDAVTYDTSKPTMIPRRMIDISAMSEKTGWYPTTPLREGLAITIKWYKQRFAKCSPEEALQ